MNSDVEYRRHLPPHGQRPPTPGAQVDSAQDDEAAARQLAYHRAPSLAPAAGTQSPTVAGVTWVRPTEMAAYAGPMVGRGVDLQAELIRRARRSPTTTARALPRLLTPSAPAVAGDQSFDLR